MTEYTVKAIGPSRTGARIELGVVEVATIQEAIAFGKRSERDTSERLGCRPDEVCYEVEENFI